MDCDKPLKKNKWNLLFLTGLCLAATLAGCYLLMPSDASEEYAYTVNSLFRFGFIPLLPVSYTHLTLPTIYSV